MKNKVKYFAAEFTESISTNILTRSYSILRILFSTSQPSRESPNKIGYFQDSTECNKENNN